MSWFRVGHERVEYAGRLTRQPFTRWCGTKEGREAIERVAARIRFAPFGRARSARRRLWRELHAASRTASFAALMRTAADDYMRVLSDLCYADALPRAHIAARRLVLAPRALACGRAGANIFSRLMQAPELAGVDEAVRTFLLSQIVREIDVALRRAAPTPKRPVHGPTGWGCVGVRVGTVWMDVLWAGPDATGHVFMYEFAGHALTRKDRKALEQAMDEMSDAVASLSRVARDALLRAATLRRI